MSHAEIPVVIGVDVGTGSARAGVFGLDGAMHGSATRAIGAWRPRAEFIQQSSADIWAAVSECVRRAMAEAGGGLVVRGIGFDATCSLVVLDAAGAPLPVEPDGDPAQDVILWADHRARAEAEEINAGGHEVLRYVGGRISLEMETPKLLWLKRHAPRSWAAARHVFDLPDFLTYRATGATSRSLCSTVCKWTYLGHEGRWDEAYFRAIGLGELADEGFARIGTTILPIATPVGGGLSAEAAAAFGLTPGIPVGTSAIDAHAGGIGVIGAALDGVAPDAAALGRRVALIGGTSSCHMAVAPEPRFVPGVWGPYHAAMLPGLWLNEGGQSATGALIDHVVTTHAAYPALAAAAKAEGASIYERLNALVGQMAAAAGSTAALTGDLHVFPDFHGNRSPRADASLLGMISGLKLAADEADCARLYLATIQAVAYGTRHIIETMNENGYAIDTIMATGGGTKNPLFLREHADATGCRIVLPAEPEAVLLGSAMIGAVAGGAYADLPAAMAAMSRAGAVIAPEAASAAFHARKYAVFRRMHDDQMAYRALMRG
ncbi:MAG TPA: FGGY-family carbohydrate kinase [Acidiphilium sp.]|jgi:FGGY-family pentulose kinase|uniref:FGGY-family carbohydrate kinase n=1 Tax=unclassified Acidiphilium TaxID=2617493 RepID=UPI000BCBB17F|nr:MULTISPECIES: FGGY-family carbohydrate kinase [unclassified Acidiphilium]OYV56821.1 MAG: ribulokinase [Acidiphilium sp. 20-67-58]HQT60424.1 FGGY-family carbohydrate kinase [Acidiphilium sp.]HQU10071.1 FGGY-family carbohydrate kinase [Acidiphilium sp.]